MTLLEQVRQGKPITGIEIIDIHAHLGRWGFSVPDVTPGGIVESMDRIGIAKTVVAPMPRISAEDASRGNREVFDAMRAYPGRLLGYVHFWPSSAEEVGAEMERCVEAGCTGVKLHNVNGFPYTHPAYAPALAVASERRMPVLVHTWAQEADFNQCREIAERYPGVSLLLAHSGSDNVEGYVRIARECDNVYLELAMSLSPRGLVQRLVEEAGVDKVVWGSDVCFLNQAQQLGKVVGADLSEQDKVKVLSTNAQRILARAGQTSAS